MPLPLEACVVSAVMTIGVALLGGVGCSVITAYMTTRALQTNRRGRARLVHEDLVRLQSTIARLVYQTHAEGERGDRSWLLTQLADTEAQQDVLAHLSGWRFAECASGLGWGEYLREAYDRVAAPSDDELEMIYRRLAGGRVAVAKLANVKYRPHDALHLFDLPTREPARELPTIPEIEARREAKGRSEGRTAVSGSKRLSVRHTKPGPLRP